MITEYRLRTILISGVVVHGNWNTDRDLILQWVQYLSNPYNFLDVGFETRTREGTNDT